MWSIDLLLKAVVLKNQSPSEATETLRTISPFACASRTLSMKSGGALFVLRDIRVIGDKHKISIIYKARRTRMASFQMMQRIHTLTAKTTKKRLLKKLRLPPWLGLNELDVRVDWLKGPTVGLASIAGILI
jgi:hypothetical protein